jgi:hypothetical protein
LKGCELFEGQYAFVASLVAEIAYVLVLLCLFLLGEDKDFKGKGG